LAHEVVTMNSFPGEFALLCSMLKLNGYNDWLLHALNPSDRDDTQRQDLTLVAILPFAGPTFSCISRVLSKQSIKTVGLLHRKVTSSFTLSRMILAWKHLTHTTFPACMGGSTLNKPGIHQDQDERATLAHPALSSREISCGQPQHKLWSLFSVSWHQYPGQEIWIYWISYYGSTEIELHPDNI